MACTLFSFSSCPEDSNLASLCLCQFQLDTTPWQSPENCFQGANPCHPGNFLSDSLLQGKQLWSNSRGVGQNVPKLEETAPEVCKDPLKIKKTTRQYKFLYGELNKTFIF